MTVMTASRPSGQPFELRFGDQRAVVVEVGGGLQSYEADGQAVLDGYGEHDMCTSGRGQILAPWPNRLEDGSYEFDGRRHQLALSEPAMRNAIHGLVRWAGWTAAEREPHRVVMQYRLHPQPGYPFSLLLAADYALSDDGLAVGLSVTNTGATTCPYGCGLHPYLSFGVMVDALELRVPGSTVIETNERGLPTATADVARTRYDFRSRRPIGPTKLDHCYTDLERGDDGRAHVDVVDPARDRRVTVWLDRRFPFVQLFTGDALPDVARRALAVEPMTCPPNAFRTGVGLLRIAPGDVLTTTFGINPRG